MNIYAMMSVVYTDLGALQSSIDPVLRTRLSDAVASYGGMTDSTTEPSLFMAYFIDEQHPDQAVRAALTLQAELNAHYNERNNRPAHLPIGITLLPLDDLENSPLKVVQSSPIRIDHQDVLASCDHLQSLSPTGGILINHDVYKYVRGSFDIDPLQPDGSATHQDLHKAAWYIIQRAKPRTFTQPIHSLAGGETFLVGRTHERAVLSKVLDIVHHERRLQVVSLLGDSGVGKSRMLDEFQNYLELRQDSAWLYRTRLEPFFKHLPYGVIRQLFAFRFEIANSDTIAMARQALVQGVQQFIPGSKGEATAHFIGHLIGMNFMYSDHIKSFADRGQPVEYRAMQAIEDYLHAVVEDDPIVMLVEGMQWADSASLALFEYIFESCQDIPILVVITASTEFAEENPYWFTSANHHQLHLAPLSMDESSELLQNLMPQIQHLPNNVRERILQTGNGNPLLIETLLLDALDLYTTNKSDAEIIGHLSQNLDAALESRIQRLPDTTRLVLEAAACVGPIFWADAIAAILNDKSPDDLPLILEELSHDDFIYEFKPSSFPVTTEYRFKHSALHAAVLRNATYVPAHHARMANWRVAHSAQRVNEYAGILAIRYENAQKAPQAIEYYLRAGKQAESVGANKEGIWFYQQALRLHEQVDVSTSKRAALLYALGRLQWEQGEFEASDVSLSASYELAKFIGDQLLEAKVVYMMGKVAHRVGNIDLGRHLLEESVKLARQIGDRPTIASGLHALGEVELDQNHFEAAQLLFNESLSTHQTARQESHLGHLMINLCRLSLGQEDYTKALSFGRTALQIGYRNHAIQIMLAALVNLSSAYAACDRPDDARLAAMAVVQHPISPELSRRQAKMVIDGLPSKDDTRVKFDEVVSYFANDV